MTPAVRTCPHCGAALPLPDDLSQLKLACPYCKRDYLVTDVVAAEVVAAQRVNAGVERSLSAHARSQRRLLLAFGAAMLVALAAVVLLLRGAPASMPLGAPSAPPLGAPSAPPPGAPSAPPLGVPSTPPLGVPSAPPRGSSPERGERRDEPSDTPPFASAAHREDEPGWRLVMQFGGEGTGPGRFDRAHNLALDAAGNVFVVDRSNRVQKFDAEGKLLSSFLAETKRTPRGPLSTDVEYGLGLAVDAAGKIYVSLGYDIQVFSAAGKLERTIAGGQNCYRELAFDQSQNLYARAHCSDEHDNAVVKLSRSGTVLKRIPEPRSFERAATGKLAVDGAGKLYVPHGYEFQIRVLDAQGKNVDLIGQRGDGPGEFSTTFLSALAFDTNGVLYALCGGQISRFEAGGRFLSRVEPRVADGTIDLAPAPDGALWILTGQQLVKKLALVR